MKNLTKKVISATLLALPSLGLAQNSTFPPVQTGSNVQITSLNQINAIIVNLVNWVTGLFFVAAVLFLFYAAYLYLSAAGDAEQLTKAKDTLIYSIVAIAVALLAGSVRFIVESILR